MTTLRLLAGASGYSYKPWKGPFYPKDLPGAEMLGFYAERLPTVEINNTFYRLPKASVLEEWAAKTPATFRFVLKASRKITHIHRLKDVGEMTDYLFKTADSLGPKLGPILFQLPPHLKKDLERLRSSSTGWRAGRQSPSSSATSRGSRTTSRGAARPQRRAVHRRDRPRRQGRRQETTPLVPTADWGYLRLRRDELCRCRPDAWADPIHDQPWSEAYVFFKHEDEGAAPKFARRFMELAGPLASRPPSSDR